MKKKILALVLAFLVAPVVFAHTVTLTWTNSVDTPVTNVYRLAGACPAVPPTAAPGGFTKVASHVTTGSFVDAAPAIGFSCYFVTAAANGIESVPSALVQVSIVPAAPSNPTATTT